MRMQDPVPTPTPAELKRATDVAGPGEPHAMLARLVGTWDLAIRMTSAAGETTDEVGSVVGKIILGGRFVVLNYRFTMGDESVEGVQILGFDRLRQHVTSSWRDDHSTWSVECAGALDPKAPERIQLRGQLHDTTTPGGRAFRMALTLPAEGGDRVAVSLHDTRDVREVLVQTQEWTRRR